MIEVPERRIRVCLVDDHQMVLDGLGLILGRAPVVEVVGTATSASAAMTLCVEKEPDVLVCDLSMPGESGLELMHKLMKVQPDLKVIVLSMHDDLNLVREVIGAGVKGYVLKNKGAEELVSAITQVVNGGLYYSQEIMLQLMQDMRQSQDRTERITHRELEIIKLVAEGLTTLQIADKLFISENTVETHRKNILRKTKTKSSVELINYARSHKLIGG